MRERKTPAGEGRGFREDELTAGMIEASMTRKASSPCTRSWSSTTLIA
jgi:hypothetical protein